jgi:DNA polymerase III delta prime subunit
MTEIAPQQPTPPSRGFILKYKPRTFSDFHFTAEFVKMMQTFITEINTLNFLFIGAAGTCKTIFLQTIIHHYYGTEIIPHSNILFINNLKEQGINYYRTEMKMFCQSQSSIYGKKKFVIIDDIDTINEQSQQVFRNCIDKYSHNINFIASCSNIQKVIESIQSRLQIIRLPPITRDHVQTVMNKIIAAEFGGGARGGKSPPPPIEKSARNFLLCISNNSIRVMINYLEKISLSVSTEKKISLTMCNKLCTDISYSVFEEYTLCVKRAGVNGKGNNNELQCAIKIFYDIFDYGYSVIDILYNYFLFIKITPILEEEEKYQIIPFLCKYITAFHNIHEDSIELALFTGNLVKMLGTTLM